MDQTEEFAFDEDNQAAGEPAVINRQLLEKLAIEQGPKGDKETSKLFVQDGINLTEIRQISIEFLSMFLVLQFHYDTRSLNSFFGGTNLILERRTGRNVEKPKKFAVFDSLFPVYSKHEYEVFKTNKPHSSLKHSLGVRTKCTQLFLCVYKL